MVVVVVMVWGTRAWSWDRSWTWVWVRTIMVVMMWGIRLWSRSGARGRDRVIMMVVVVVRLLVTRDRLQARFWFLSLMRDRIIVTVRTVPLVQHHANCLWS